MNRVVGVLGLAAFAAVSVFAWRAGGDALWVQFFNLGLLLGVLIYLTRKPVLNYLGERRARIQADLASSEQLLQEAESKLAEWSAKAERLDADINEVRRISRQRTEDERQRILDEAQLSAERIRSGASAAVKREVQRARSILRDEAADLAVELAGQMLGQQVTDADRDRLVDEFVTRVEQRSDSGQTPPTGSA